MPDPRVRRRADLDLPAGRYLRMLEIRTLEDALADMFAAGEVRGTTHLCQGQEALAVALATVLSPQDVVTATYRGHGIALALGMEPQTLLREVLGRRGGCAGGVGGSMHLVDSEIGLLPTFAIVGAGLPVACGAGLAMQVMDKAGIAVAVFGDGATNIGAFHESLNLAAIWALPVLFVIDNNVYGEYSRWNLTTPIERLADRAASYAMPSASVDGMDIPTLLAGLGAAADHVRSGAGPFLLEAKTYRFAGHSRSDQATYRPPGELEAWRLRDPVALARAALLASGMSEEELGVVEAAVIRQVQEAIDEARLAEPAGREAMFANVVAGVHP